MSKNLQHISEEALLAMYYQQRDNIYIGELLSRYTLRLLGVCLKYLKDEDSAKDMVQQVFEKVLQDIGKYKIDNFGGWLYRIAQNACISQIRLKKPVAYEAELMTQPVEEDADRAYFWAVDRKYEHLQTALGRLKPDQGVCVEAFFLQKKSYQEIAHEYGYSLAEVKSHIQNGKRNLRIIIEALERGSNV